MALGIYVHLPFCPYVCPYCDFAKWPMRRSAASAYLDALRAELAREAPATASTIFLGGGTPNAYDASTIAALVAALRERFAPPPGASQEISIEINPELVRAGDFEAYAAAGIDRVSIGVQSFVPSEIATLGRKHTPADVERAVVAARAAGIRSVSLDLIFAVPGQSAQSWRSSLDAALALDIDHCSTYGLTVEAGTPYEGWQAREPSAFLDDAREAELYEIAIATLESAGFEHYEISNFARPGHRSRHNANYWANGEYIGLGVGAASYREGVRSVHTRELATYLEAVTAGRPIPSEAERLEGLAALGEAIMLALRTAQGVELAAFKERYGVDVLERYAPVVATYRDAGVLDLNDGYMRLTRRGRFVANDVCGAFVVFA
ncbi:MAG: radical SAM family heme chaperone HemW [bacterium]|nr:radical SAM family heme chaperone HemW [bacterium]